MSHLVHQDHRTVEGSTHAPNHVPRAAYAWARTGGRESTTSCIAPSMATEVTCRPTDEAHRRIHVVVASPGPSE